MDVERDNQVGEPEDPAPDAGPEVREDEGGRAFREAETAADATLSLGEPGVPPAEVDEAWTGVEEEPVVSAAPLWEPPSSLPEPPRRRSGVIVVAALVAALAGGLVSYPVALRVAQREGERTIDIPSSSRTARSPAPPGSTARVVEDIRPSIAAIFTQTIRRDLFFEAVPSQGAGTGIVLDSKGHILTNSHVVRGAQEIEVVLSDGRKLAARVAGDDPASDLAVLNVDAGGLRPAPFGNSDDLRVGDRVIAVGHALALPGGPTVTEGIVSALDRSIREPNGVTLEHLNQKIGRAHV